MVSYGWIAGLAAIVGMVFARGLNEAKIVRLGKDGIKAKVMSAPDDWDPAVLKKMVYEDKSGGLDPSIINGELVTSPTKYPSVVALLWIDPVWEVSDVVCTGAMIDSNLVLTAAQCVQDLNPNYYWYVCGGKVDLYDGDIWCTFFETWWWPEAYDHDQFWLGHDLAVIRVNESMLVDPIKTIKVSLTKPQTGTAAVAAGYGFIAPDEYGGYELRQTDVSVVLNDGQCTFLTNQGLGGDPQLICSDGFSDGAPSGICSGDGGSPLIIPGATSDDQYTVGVASFTAEECNPSEVSVYASLYDADHIAFLREVVQEAGGSFTEANPEAATPKPTPAPTAKPTPAPTPAPSTPSQCPPCPTTSPPQTVLRVSETRMAACSALGDISCLEQPDPITSTCCAEATAVLECWIPVLKEAAPDQVASSQAVLTQLRRLCA